jgi:hypothetical protein
MPWGRMREWTNTLRTSGGFSLRGPSSKLQLVISLRTASRSHQQLPGASLTDSISKLTRKHSAPGLGEMCLPGQDRPRFRHTTLDFQKTGEQRTLTAALSTTERTRRANGRCPGSIGQMRIGSTPELSTHSRGYRKRPMAAFRFFCISCVWVSLAFWHKHMWPVLSGAQRAPSGPWQSGSTTEMPIWCSAPDQLVGSMPILSFPAL